MQWPILQSFESFPSGQNLAVCRRLSDGGPRRNTDAWLMHNTNTITDRVWNSIVHRHSHINENMWTVKQCLNASVNSYLYSSLCKVRQSSARSTDHRPRRYRTTSCWIGKQAQYSNSASNETTKAHSFISYADLQQDPACIWQQEHDDHRAHLPGR